MTRARVSAAITSFWRDHAERAGRERAKARVDQEHAEEHIEREHVEERCP